MRYFALVIATAMSLGACSMAGGLWPGRREHTSSPIESSAPPPVGGIAAFQNAPMTPAALMAHVSVLASDEFEGREPGTRGEDLTIDYITRAFAAAGLEPGAAGGGWTQETPIVTATVTNNPTLRLGEYSYVFGTDFVAWTKRSEPITSLQNAELVFVGYGIVSPENNWNDYAGVDMRGKVAVILVNDPDFDTGDNRGFGGRAMTYYGRWTYKFEEAARQGAAGALIVHEDAAAAYGWGTVQSSWTGPQVDLLRADSGASRVAIEGWIQNGVAQMLFQRAGLNFAAERRRAQQRGFTPAPLRQTMSIQLETSLSQTRSHNVIGVLRGRSRPQEAVLYTAHWDHLGHCTPVDGDDICNGALDNATGVAGLIELARRFSGDARPERSVAFIAFTAEESGLLGSAFYAQNPAFAPLLTAAAFNMDGLSIYGPARDITVVGYGQSDLDRMLGEAAAAQNRVVTPDATPERGSYYRSDHFNLAKIGIPSLYAHPGLDLYEGGTARGRQLSENYVANAYHRPNDEISPTWDMTGAMRDLQLLYAVGRRVADANTWPQWNASSEFRAVREAQRSVRRNPN